MWIYERDLKILNFNFQSFASFEVRVPGKTDPTAEVDVPAGRVPADRRGVSRPRFRVARKQGENHRHHPEDQTI